MLSQILTGNIIVSMQYSLVLKKMNFEEISLLRRKEANKS
jgi:hypothetical protein